MSRVFKQHTTKVDPKTGKRVSYKSKKWYGEYVDENGKTVRVPLSTDKASANTMLAAREKQAERRRSGLEDATTEAFQQPLSGHLEGFKRTLKRVGNSDKHVTVTFARVRDLAEWCNAKSLGGLTVGNVEAFLSAKQRDGMSPRTSNGYLAALKQFGKWLVNQRRIDVNPWECLQPRKIAGDVRRQRRAASLDELDRLIA